MIFDFIVVGAGSAGCIVASRLSESGRHSVLLIEAGGEDKSFWFKIPVGYAKSYYNPKVNWMYRTEPEANLGGRRIYAPRGKVQGGSGSINAMVFVRGAAEDFDDWRAAGNPGWGFDDVLPYFRKLETHAGGECRWHGGSGPIHVTPMRGATHPVSDAFLDACNELDIPLNEDFNGETIEGAGVYDVNTRRGQRSHSSAEYLRPALKRPNLTIEREAHARRLLVETDGRVSGIEVMQHRRVRTFGARREVILAAGAVDTPKLMQLSGFRRWIDAVCPWHRDPQTSAGRRQEPAGPSLRQLLLPVETADAERRFRQPDRPGTIRTDMAFKAYRPLRDERQPGGRLLPRVTRGDAAQYPGLLQPTVLSHPGQSQGRPDAGALSGLPHRLQRLPPDQQGHDLDRLARRFGRSAHSTKLLVDGSRY
ncbi:MAG: GMC family oxidoreductase N-terminal domain-containing protein [Rhizobium sp.]|nr:GMC family oxidoreductase N-terminal domain-containing protein [Rhizobium sp.]